MKFYIAQGLYIKLYGNWWSEILELNENKYCFRIEFIFNDEWFVESQMILWLEFWLFDWWYDVFEYFSIWTK